MGISTTGRVYDYKKEFKRKLDILVGNYERRQRAKSFKSFRNKHLLTAICSQCKRKMRKDVADIQIENKRENAPICFACINGIDRKQIIYKHLGKKEMLYKKTHRKAIHILN